MKKTELWSRVKLVRHLMPSNAPTAKDSAVNESETVNACSDTCFIGLLLLRTRKPDKLVLMAPNRSHSPSTVSVTGAFMNNHVV
ncbi:unnamed protein product [Medioppia subpectinata]|uniref:Uncharacterized protein n=1 Tax=Medioppia subpectinata TaxID=1979941 RepID=A0A7R9KI40_9ACAR|nr:unnamed protein product [Medioppia subpectinata]CAG2102588.1 unnamed protein product [Medioppia subpectinata]